VTLVAWAEERPERSGHYVATLITPKGGIKAVDIGVADPGCQTSACATNGWMLEISDELSGFSEARAPAAGAPARPTGAATESTVTPSRPMPIRAPLLPIGLACCSSWLEQWVAGI
jgi:hypothetical protein